ncbi:MAG: DUF1592 domain-containing protein [Verrucomicrobiota bacterium]
MGVVSCAAVAVVSLAPVYAVAVVSLAPVYAAEEEAREVLFSFMEKYCLDCHDSLVQKAERDFESFDFPLETVHDLISAKEIIDQVTLREMPPKDSDQPTDEERIAVIRALRDSLSLAHGKIESSDALTVMRRLSNREYEETLRVLFDRRVDTLGLTADFPKEKTSRHIDTIGKSLVTSGFLLDQYFQAAQRLVESRLGKPEMEPKTWHFTDNFVQYEELSGPHRAAFKFKYLCLYEQPNTDTRQGGYGHIEDFLEGVPVSGIYEIKALAAAKHRDTHYDPEIFGIDFSEPFILGVVPGDVTAGHIHYPQAIEPLLAQKVVPDNEPEWITFRVWLEKGQTPRFIFPNGPFESRASISQINKRYKDEFKGEVSRVGISRTHILREGALPRIQISEIKIHGPIPEKNGTREEIAVFGKEGFREEKALDQLFSFASKAFRRPLEEADRASIRRTYEARMADDASARQAALDTVKMILCSPSFLYFAEITEEDERKLKPHDLATRLSYALWALPPDEKLRAKADSGKLTELDELRKEAERLLDDKRYEGFISGFLDSWLNLRDLGGMPPPREKYRHFYAEDLPASMKKEAHLFFEDLMVRNGSIERFLDSDYTFVDKKLANLYDLPEKKEIRLADGFEKVTLPNETKRGGLLGMAGVLTVSANGVETSPVTRGVWVSENILGVEPPAPPDEVPSIDSDVSSAKTIRERLELHSSDKTCYECHRKIDPLGFPLETFDPIGQWRTSYPKPKNGPAPNVDSSGEFSSGEAFKDFQEFKKLLLSTRRDTFAEHLITQLLSYSTGRHMEPVDQYEIDEILAAVKADNYGLRTLLLECVTSEIFWSR